MNMKKILLATCALAMVGGIDANASGRPRFKIAPQFLTNLGITKDQLRQDAQTVGKHSTELSNLVTKSTQSLTALQQSAGQTVSELETACKDQSAIIARQMQAINTLSTKLDTERNALTTKLKEAEDSALGLTELITSAYNAKDKAALDAAIPDTPEITEIEMMLRIMWAHGHPTAGVDVNQLMAKLAAPLTAIKAPDNIANIKQQLQQADAQLQAITNQGTKNTNNP